MSEARGQKLLSLSRTMNSTASGVQRSSKVANFADAVKKGITSISPMKGNLNQTRTTLANQGTTDV